MSGRRRFRKGGKPMLPRSIHLVLILPFVLLFPATCRAQDRKETTVQPEKPKTSTPANKAARDVLARFDNGDPGWKARMEGLITLVKAGPDVVPLLTEALKKGSPLAREYAAQALVLF